MKERTLLVSVSSPEHCNVDHALVWITDALLLTLHRARAEFRALEKKHFEMRSIHLWGGICEFYAGDAEALLPPATEENELAEQMEDALENGPYVPLSEVLGGMDYDWFRGELKPGVGDVRTELDRLVIMRDSFCFTAVDKYSDDRFETSPIPYDLVFGAPQLSFDFPRREDDFRFSCSGEPE